MNDVPTSLLRQTLPLISGVSLLLFLLLSTTAQGATYYVATTGSDSNPGTSASPWRNPQKCAASPIKAGDTCIVRSGTYTAPSSKPNLVVYIGGASASGTSSLPITIKSEKPLGASMIVPSTASTTNAAFYLSRPYYIIEGFDISGGANNGSSAGFAGIHFTSSATGTIIRSNSIHHVGRSVCSNSVYGFSGIFINKTSSVVVERNRIYSIGRRRNGESGCSTSLYQNDHGVYVVGAPSLVVRRNVFYDTNRGWPIHVYGGTTSNLRIYHNTFSGRSPTGKPIGQIMLASTINTAYIKNNISTGAQTGLIVSYGLSASSVSVTYNHSDTQIRAQPSIPNVAFSNNYEKSTNLNFISKSTNDFRLSSTSGAIDRGTPSGVPIVPDGLPDNGGYEYALQSTLSSPLTPTGVKAQ